MESEQLIEQLGGPEAIREIVNDMYDRVFQDDLLSPVFAQANPDRLREMQYEFLLSALGGPVRYSGTELRSAHAGRGISAQHFTAFVDHLINAMSTRSAPQSVIDQVVAELAMFRDKIIGAANVDG